MSDTPHCYRHPGRETLVSCSECGRPICEDCMTFAPVGIRCPDHANIGAVKQTPARTIQSVRGRTRSVAAPATMVLIALNVVVYVITAAQGGGPNLPGGQLFADWALQGAIISTGEWWRLVTAMFLHGSLLHLAFNMLALYWLGNIIEDALGTPRFLIVYIVSGLAGSAGALWFSSAFAVTVGASGAIFGLIGALLILEYFATGSLMGQAMILILVNFAFTFAVPGISKGGHIGGLIGGIVATYALMRYRQGPRQKLGVLVAIGVGVLSLVLAYVRVESYLA
jgi:membrane associated rhomboid family serine protease